MTRAKAIVTQDSDAGNIYVRICDDPFGNGPSHYEVQKYFGVDVAGKENSKIIIVRRAE